MALCLVNNDFLGLSYFQSNHTETFFAYIQNDLG